MSLAIKICGLTTPEALNAALECGASHVGFIFFPKSPRDVTPYWAGQLVFGARLRGLTARVVAVTVDADDDLMDTILGAIRPDLWQLHGSETPERVAAVKERYQLPVMKALSVSTAADLDRIEPYLGIADQFLFDAKPPRNSELPGGNGVAFDWSIVKNLDPSIPYFLSGGLNAANVGEALRIAGLPGIDVSSGVESAPGTKDLGMIADFFEAVREAGGAQA